VDFATKPIFFLPPSVGVPLGSAGSSSVHRLGRGEERPSSMAQQVGAFAPGRKKAEEPPKQEQLSPMAVILCELCETIEKVCMPVHAAAAHT
jgi:hypothetical protein